MDQITRWRCSPRRGDLVSGDVGTEKAEGYEIISLGSLFPGIRTPSPLRPSLIAATKQRGTERLATETLEQTIAVSLEQTIAAQIPSQIRRANLQPVTLEQTIDCYLVGSSPTPTGL